MINVCLMFLALTGIAGFLYMLVGVMINHEKIGIRGLFVMIASVLIVFVLLMFK